MQFISAALTQPFDGLNEGLTTACPASQVLFRLLVCNPAISSVRRVISRSRPEPSSLNYRRPPTDWRLHQLLEQLAAWPQGMNHRGTGGRSMSRSRR